MHACMSVCMCVTLEHHLCFCKLGGGLWTSCNQQSCKGNKLGGGLVKSLDKGITWGKGAIS